MKNKKSLLSSEQIRAALSDIAVGKKITANQKGDEYYLIPVEGTLRKFEGELIAITDTIADGVISKKGGEKRQRLAIFLVDYGLNA